MVIPAGLDGLGVVSVVLLMGLLVIRGLLVPRNIYLDKVREGELKDQQLRTKDEQLAEKDKQLGHLDEVGRTMQAVLQAIQQRVADDEAGR